MPDMTSHCPQEEPYAEEAYLFMRQLALQRSVEFEVETADRRGATCCAAQRLSGTSAAMYACSAANQAL